MRVALLLVLTLSLTAEAHAKCARVEIAAKPLTPANTAIADGGGILVGLTYSGREGGDDKVEQPTWRIKRGGKSVEPKIRLIAPGLAVYETPEGTLVDGKGKALVTVKRGTTKLLDLTTPVLKTAIGTHNDNAMERWGSSSMLGLDTTADPPAAAIGVIVYQAGKPIHWMAFEKDAASKRAARFRSGGHCSNDLPGTSVPTTGDITVAWFDASGRVSAPSKPLAIVKKT